MKDVIIRLLLAGLACVIYMLYSAWRDALKDNSNDDEDDDYYKYGI